MEASTAPETTGTAVAAWEGAATKVAKIANLDESWTPEKVFALIKLLPEGFQDPLSAASFVLRATRAGLDPFTNEIYAWRDGNNLTFHTGRDGWIKTARHDDDIVGLEFGLIYEGDEFNWQQVDQRVKIDHKGGLSQGRVEGAYCVVHMQNMDHLERRTVNDYKHLAGKSNWKNYLPDMLLTRTVAAAVKFCSPLGAGIDVPPDYAPDVYQKEQGGVDVLRKKMDEKAAALGQQLAGETEPVELEDETPEAVDEPEEEIPENHFPCPYCEKSFETGPALGGHVGTHKAERILEQQLKGSGYKILNEEGTFIVVDPAGAYYDIDPKTGEPWATWGDAAMYVKLELQDRQEDPHENIKEEIEAQGPSAPPADADEEEIDNWLDGQE